MMETENGSGDINELTKADMEALFEKAFNKPQKGGYLEAQSDVSKSQSGKATPIAEKGGGKSSLRLKYEAEVQVIKKTCGDLEAIRRQLGLSKRKMSQLLLVDPSAWTRWTSENGEASPQIYRSLQWYLILQDKHPELKSSIWLNSVASPQISQKELATIKKQLIRELKQEWGQEGLGHSASSVLKRGVSWLEARPKAVQILIAAHTSVLFFLLILFVSR